MAIIICLLMSSASSTVHAWDPCEMVAKKTFLSAELVEVEGGLFVHSDLCAFRRLYDIRPPKRKLTDTLVSAQFDEPKFSPSGRKIAFIDYLEFKVKPYTKYRIRVYDLDSRELLTPFINTPSDPWNVIAQLRWKSEKTLEYSYQGKHGYPADKLAKKGWYRIELENWREGDSIGAATDWPLVND